MSTREFVKLNGQGIPSRSHVCVVFGGWGGPVSGGQENIDYDFSGAARFAERVRALGLTVKDWQGALNEDATALVLAKAHTFVRENFQPKGKLIIYGYSAGGINALKFARELEERPPKPNCLVDLLITIDAYRSGVSPSDRRVPKNVMRSINIYQRHIQIPTGSHGARSWREEKNEGSHDCNQDRTNWKEYKERGSGFAGIGGGGAHAYIDEDTDEVVYRKVDALISGGPDAVDCNLN